jgi:glycosyltransferase involved in cell wall biosynthesis
MAAYNGAAHIREQLDSILAQLGPSDEVIVVDDGSTDGTKDFLRSMADPRVRVVFNESNLGYVRNFEKALGLSTGEIIMLSDQDDVWLPGRVDVLVTALEGAELAASNFSYFGGSPSRIERLRLKSGGSRHRILNLVLLWIGIRPYYGCSMSMTRGFLQAALPFPAFLTETHDKWLAMLANVRGTIVHVESETLSRRLHETNTTPKSFRGWNKVARSRWMLTRALAEAVVRRHA